MIPRETIDQIRDAVDIVDVVGQYLRLKKRGRNFIALCPFHTEKTPSFNVSPDRQMYHCFGCGVSGNAFTFLMEHEKMTFVEAARFLAAKANITIRETGSGERRESLDKITYAQTVALEYFKKTLRVPSYSKVLNDYLQDKRGIGNEAIEFFQLGLAGEAWDGLLTFAAAKDLSGQDLEKAGLAIYSEKKGGHFDRFRQRLMIPVFNLSGKPIAFGGRTLKRGEPAKYVNSPETPLYSKSFVLYGLNFARNEIRDANDVIVVEGYFDVISLWQAGIKNVVASSGTAFTAQQARLLARFCESVYLFFDADSAGQQAALRSVDVLYDAGLEVKIILAPEGEDPDSLARTQGAEAIVQLKQNAIGFVPFRMREVDLGATGLIGKEKLVKELAALAAKINDPVRRSLFISEAAGALNVAEELLKTGQSSRRDDTVPSARRASYNKIEMEFLSLLMNYRGPVARTLEKISPDDFDSKKLSRLYGAMITQHEVEGSIDPGRLIETFDDTDMISLVGEVAMIDWDEDTITDDLHQFTEQLLRQKRGRIRNRLKEQLAEAEAAGDQAAAERIIEEMKSYGL